ncbi:MAG: long-chain-fatty-acid--CoA ligase [Alphaproteobacteria bacterium]|jgi:long-chain acyl-CoA synthetase|nr:long-chain-fatty-acid--CoA ligase [Alphaproteobacteria bacterium]MDP6815666.1 long-chain-fatty-acid--CoA ligase [Alphaproteobacteria bacterium]
MRISSTIRRAAQVNGNGLATDYLDRQQTWSEFASRIARLAGGLRGIGLAPGDRIAMLALNSDRYLEYFFAVPWAGGVFVPINTRLAPPEILYWLNDSGATTLLIDDNFAPLLPKLQGQMDTVKTIVHVGDGAAPEGMLSFEGLIDGVEEMPPIDKGGHELAGLFYTGGTTGRSKGVMLSHRNLLLNAIQFAGVAGFRADTNYLHAAPMFHLANGAATFCIASMAGTSTIITAFEPIATLEAMQNKRVSLVLLVPTMVNMVVNHPEAGNYDLSSLQDVLYGASPMPEAVINKAMEVIPNAGFHQAYGQTEAGPVLTMLGPERHVTDGPLAGKMKSAGQAIPGVEVCIVDEDDNEMPPDTVGEICGRGENVMLGYWNQTEMSAETLRNGWLHTGDGGRMDEDGFVYVVDRVKDMIISGGENVYSAEVENAIYQHPGVAECAVIGIPHEKWGEQVHAIVRLKEGEAVDEGQIIGHCHEVIANYKCPRSVEFHPEPLPLSGAGKILKTELRKPYWEGEEKQVH